MYVTTEPTWAFYFYAKWTLWLLLVISTTEVFTVSACKNAMENIYKILNLLLHHLSY